MGFISSIIVSKRLFAFFKFVSILRTVEDRIIYIAQWFTIQLCAVFFEMLVTLIHYSTESVIHNLIRLSLLNNRNFVNDIFVTWNQLTVQIFNSVIKKSKYISLWDSNKWKFLWYYVIRQFRLSHTILTRSYVHHFRNFLHDTDISVSKLFLLLKWAKYIYWIIIIII